MYQAFAIRPIGNEVLFNNGGFFDSSFTPTNFAGRSLSGELYSAGAGLFRTSQFTHDLVQRGLMNCSYGPALKNMPFYETVRPMIAAIEDFVTVYVDTYSPSDRLLVQDHELQAWVQEANEVANVLDFPLYPLTSRETLVDILSHLAFLTGIAHHVLNGATPGESSSILPLHPSAFNLPLPTTKGIPNLMPYLHSDTEALKQASLMVRFNRPQLELQKGSLFYMFAGEEFLAHASDTVKQAAKVFSEKIGKISDAIRGQKFDARGLAQGMPFIWRSLGPRRIPYYLAV